MVVTILFWGPTSFEGTSSVFYYWVKKTEVIDRGPIWYQSSSVKPTTAHKTCSKHVQMNNTPNWVITKQALLIA